MIRRLAILTLLVLGYSAAAAAQAGTPVAITHVGPRTGGADVTTTVPVNCISGCAGGVTDTDDGTVAGNQTGNLMLSLSHVWDGSNWKRFTIGTAGVASSQIVTVQGIASMTPLLATVTCTSGCAGGTNDTDDGTVVGGQIGNLMLSLSQVWDGANWKRFTVGTAGTASSEVITVQGIASMTPLLAAQSGTWNIGTVTTLPAITFASPQAVTESGTWTVQPGNTANTTPWLFQIRDAAGNARGANVDSANRLSVSIDANTAGSRTDTDAATIAAGQTNNADVLGFMFGYNGSAWARIGATSNQLDADLKSGAVASGAVASGAFASGSIASGAVASGAIASGAFASGSVSAGAYSVGAIPPAAGILVGGGTSAMTGTTSTSVIAGVGSNYLYITSCSFSNTHASVTTMMSLQDGSGGTILWQGIAPFGGGNNITFPVPLKVATIGNGLFVANVTTGSNTFAFCSGFTSTVSY